ncbi:C40 family peptidase [Reichenbachiella agarivorans]|uniref:C40 family peptidase n=1 Tax=Reichenbachiella agarivorans TaxID=2979464 RepID=A0ABY6CML1_9BACT|nr:C40 family peptidase [Reichenbachiella agarivorans]UXP31746.1 C40 family peptidase [Reichenbachiella agarivorans]
MKNILVQGVLWMGLIAATFLIGCQSNGEEIVQHLNQLNDSIRSVYAPDKRVAVYDISLDYNHDSLTIQGETDQPQALSALLSVLNNESAKVVNQVVTLPDSSVGAYQYALVNNSVCNIRSAAKHSSELATQAILGTSLRLLKLTEEWYLVQTPDGYISWVDHGGVQLMTASEQLMWSKSPQIIYMHNYGNVYLDENESGVLSDIVLGARLVKRSETKDHIAVQFPDMRVGYVRKSEIQDFTAWREAVQPSGDLVVDYAKDLLGSPYLWGGTSTKGMDCSGFTKTAYLMNGYVIPRDASQQVSAGVVVDPDLQFEGLEKGDLLFFGRAATDSTKQRVTHVGIWMGEEQFIHASQMVRISSIDTASEHYDAFNKNRYLGSRRYLGNEIGISRWY